MAQFYVNYNGEAGLSENKKLLKTIKDVTTEDELIISMESEDAHQADQLFAMLDENQFKYLPKGDETGHKYHIYAKRK